MRLPFDDFLRFQIIYFIGTPTDIKGRKGVRGVRSVGFQVLPVLSICSVPGSNVVVNKNKYRVSSTVSTSCRRVPNI